MKQRVEMKTTIVILAAGEGTRMKSSIPKSLHRVAGKSMLRHIVDTTSNIEPEQLIVVHSPNTEDTIKEELFNIAITRYGLRLSSPEGKLEKVREIFCEKIHKFFIFTTSIFEFYPSVDVFSIFSEYHHIYVFRMPNGRGHTIEPSDRPAADI